MSDVNMKQGRKKNELKTTALGNRSFIGQAIKMYVVKQLYK